MLMIQVQICAINGINNEGSRLTVDLKSLIHMRRGRRPQRELISVT